MNFDQNRILTLAGLSDDSEAGMLNENAGANLDELNEEQKIRNLVREEIKKAHEEKREAEDVTNIQNALKERNLSIALGSSGYVSGMVHGNEGKVPSGKLRRGSYIGGIGFH